MGTPTLRREVGRHAMLDCDAPGCDFGEHEATGRKAVNALYAKARRHVRESGHAVAVQDTYFVRLSVDDRPPERTVVVWGAGR